MINDIRELKVLCMVSTVKIEYFILLIGSHQTDNPVTELGHHSHRRKALLLPPRN